MSRRSLWASLLVAVVVSAGLLAFNLGFGNTPVLGLDLQGGVSVILAPADDASDEDLTVIRDLIRDELEQRGIAEPDVRVEGSNIVVDLPGVRDQQQAIDAVDVAGIVTLQPVMQCGLTDPSAIPATSQPTATSAPTATSEPSATSQPTATSAPTATTAADATTTPSGWRRATPDTTVPGTTPDTTPDSTVPGSTPDSTPDTTTAGTATETTVPTTPIDPTTATGQQLLPLRDGGGSCLVGPAGATGEVFSRGSAEVTLNQGAWGVVVGLRSEGVPVWNSLVSQCFQGAATCPSRQIAIVLDGVIQSAPTVNEAGFTDTVSITGSFSEGEARSLARVLNRGAFPVGVETEAVQSVSPTLGSDALRAAVVAGLIGAAIIVAGLLAYYRRLGAIAVAGLLVWAMAMYSASVLVSEATNYALSLAGVTGIIVAVGMAVDSYVVLFERLKDEVSAGRSIRNAAPRSFSASWRTIVSANVMSVMAALILFWLSVGSVKGFALYLGLTTVCNMIVYYLFARPAVFLLARNGWLSGRRGLGIGAAA